MFVLSQNFRRHVFPESKISYALFALSQKFLVLVCLAKISLCLVLKPIYLRVLFLNQ